MKVAHLLRKYDPAEWGGTETALHGLCDGLRQGGVESVVFCPALPHRPARDPLAEVGCAVKRFRACVPIWGASAESKRSMVAVGGNLMSFQLFWSLWREPGVDVIHSHATGRLGAIGRLVARLRGVPFLFTTHGGIYDLPATLNTSLHAPAPAGFEWGKVFGMLLRTRNILSQADAILTCNEREAELIRVRHTGRRVVMQPHGVPAKAFAEDRREAARAAFPRIADRRVLLAVGRIDAVKNQSWLIERLPMLARRHPGLLLVLAGAVTDEGYAETLRERIAELRLEDSVLMVGGLPPGDPRLVGLLQEAWAVVLPSVSETFGLVILEAWAAGTVVISSLTSGAKSLVEPGKTGLLFDLGRPEEFHAGIDELWLNPETASRLAEAGRRRVVADFDTRILADRMRLLYQNLIEEKACAT